jgi:hypothetical protein
MNLFSRKTLKRHIKADPIPSDHLAAQEAWEELITSGRIESLKETLGVRWDRHPVLERGKPVSY